MSTIGNHKKLEQEQDLQDQLTDLWEVIHRHLGLVLTTIAIIVGLGALYYLKAPRTYESISDILISTKHVSGFTSGEEQRPVSEKSMETHALMVQSPMIVEQAVEDFDLASLPTVLEEEDTVQFIIENLMVSLKDENSTVLSVQYRSTDPHDSKAVAEAIAITYETFLGTQNQETGKETTRLVSKASDILGGQMRRIEEEYRSFQKSAPLMWRDGQGVNVHHERQSEIETARKELMVERTVLQAKADSLDAALASGGVSRDAIRLQALNELKPETNNAANYYEFRMAEQENVASREAIRQYSSLLMGEYVRLMVERSQLMDEFGSGHPKVNSVEKRKSEVKRLLNGLVAQDTTAGSLMSEDWAEDDTDYVGIYMQMLRDRLTILDQQIRRLDEEFQAEQRLANAMQEYLLKDQAFRSERDQTRQLFDVVVAQLKEINLVNDYGGDTATILAKAELGEQVAPRIAYTGVASLFLGCLLGSILAWAVDRSENLFRSAAEIRQALHVPVIGRIPLMSARDQIASPEYPGIAPIVCTLHQEKSYLAEAFRGVRTSLYFSAAGQNLKVIQVTSPLPGDGKSTVTANLAVAIAKSGKRVLVMDADFRRPSMSKLLGKSEDRKFGLAAVIAGKADPIDSALETEIPNLYFLPAHERPLSPSELLSTQQFKNLLDSVRERFDFILIDTPPLLAVTDPCAVAARADGVILTLRIRKGVQAVSTRAMEMLEGIDANVLGVIVNGADPKKGFPGSSGGYGSYGGYGGYGNYSDDYSDQKQSAKPTRVAALPPFRK